MYYLRRYVNIIPEEYSIHMYYTFPHKSYMLHTHQNKAMKKLCIYVCLQIFLDVDTTCKCIHLFTNYTYTFYGSQTSYISWGVCSI